MVQAAGSELLKRVEVLIRVFYLDIMLLEGWAHGTGSGTHLHGGVEVLRAVLSLNEFQGGREHSFSGLVIHFDGLQC